MRAIIVSMRPRKIGELIRDLWVERDCPPGSARGLIVVAEVPEAEYLAWLKSFHGVERGSLYGEQTHKVRHRAGATYYLVDTSPSASVTDSGSSHRSNS